MAAALLLAGVASAGLEPRPGGADPSGAARDTVRVGVAADSAHAAPRAAAAGTGAAPGARGDSTAAAGGGAPAPAATRADSLRARPKLFDQPRWVMARSLVIPGWGQLHNRAWIKAAAVAASETYLIARIVQDDSALKGLNAEVNAARDAGDADAEQSAVDRYNTRLDRVVGREWLLAGLVTYALMDAYVDAHFVRFKFEFQHDPALPGGPPGAKVVVEKRF